jgi:hypothetical protein
VLELGSTWLGPQAACASLDRRFADAVNELTSRVASSGINVEDEVTDAEVRRWLDGDGPALAWSGSGITADEWFFVTTLYGTMTLDGQRTHIRRFFPLFVEEVRSDIRNFEGALLANWRLLHQRVVQTLRVATSPP